MKCDEDKAAGGGPWIGVISLQQLGDACSKNPPCWLPDPEWDCHWKANAVCTGSGLGNWEPRGADAVTWEGGLGLCVYSGLANPELEAVLVKQKISRAP